CQRLTARKDNGRAPFRTRPYASRFDSGLSTTDSRLIRAGRAGGLPHPFGDDADLLDPGALGGVDDVDDVFVAQRPGAGDEHRLVFALLVDVAKPLFQLRDRDVLLVDGDVPIGRVLEHDLADV